MQNQFLGKVSNTEKAYSWTSTFASIGSYVGNVPTLPTAIIGNSLSVLSGALSADGQRYTTVLDLYNETGFEAAKAFAKITSGDFDQSCSMVLNFATVEEDVSFMNEPPTVLQKFFNNPGRNLKPGDMKESRSKYYFTVMWKNNEGNTLGGTQIQVDKSTYEKLQKYAKEITNE